jgi:hypothetical protein
MNVVALVDFNWEVVPGADLAGMGVQQPKLTFSFTEVSLQQNVRTIAGETAQIKLTLLFRSA